MLDTSLVSGAKSLSAAHSVLLCSFCTVLHAWISLQHLIWISRFLFSGFPLGSEIRSSADNAAARQILPLLGLCTENKQESIFIASSRRHIFTRRQISSKSQTLESQILKTTQRHAFDLWSCMSRTIWFWNCPAHTHKTYSSWENNLKLDQIWDFLPPSHFSSEYIKLTKILQRVSEKNALSFRNPLSTSLLCDCQEKGQKYLSSVSGKHREFKSCAIKIKNVSTPFSFSTYWMMILFYPSQQIS